MVPYAREPMEAVHDADVRSVCLMWASQTTKTTLLENVLGYFVAADPSPILMVQPTVEMAQAWSKERFMVTVRDTPVLRDVISDPKSRDSGNTIQLKVFPGGNLAIVGANAPSGLAGRPRRVVLLDEVDRYPASAGTEGDPCALAIRRTESFWNAVIIMTSTPTIKGLSRIEAEFLQTDQRYWHVPCPRCGQHQVLKWSMVRWPEGRPEDAAIQCQHCEAILSDTDRVAMIRDGEWRPTAPFAGRRGYHLSGIYSPFRVKKGYRNRLHQMASQFLEANSGGEETLKTWVNTFLAETWTGKAETIEPLEVMQRREDYGPELPEGVLVLTWGADVQADRIEAEVVGWGLGEECWGIRCGRFIGNVNESDSAWRQLSDFISLKFSHPLYGAMQAKVGCVDSGFATTRAYEFVRRSAPAAVYAVKGATSRLRAPVETPRRRSRSQALLVDTSEFKTIIYSRLKGDKPGPRYCHFPKTYDEEFFLQLTAEQVVTKMTRGFPSRIWENVRSNRRNEALDIRVYNHAALYILQPNFVKLREYLERHREIKVRVADKPEPGSEPAKLAKRVPGPVRQGGWVSGWRG